MITIYYAKYDNKDMCLKKISWPRYAQNTYMDCILPFLIATLINYSSNKVSKLVQYAQQKKMRFGVKHTT